MIDVKNKSTDPTGFYEEIISWMAQPPLAKSPCKSGLEHVMLMLHEGTHLLYKRECGFEPKLYGPSNESYYRRGIGWRRQLGAVESLPHGISLTADILLVAKSILGSAYIEERVFGEHNWKQAWNRASGDFENYHNWFNLRGQIIGDMFDADRLPVVSPAKIRKAVYTDFSDCLFRRHLMDAAREYERRVFGTSD